jgi:hypothetical protein
MGTTDSGHYYSFIRDRSKGSGNMGEWYEFNDSSVTPFDPKDLPAETFGGTTKSTTYGRGGSVETEKPIIKNAYMLVFQRKHPVALTPEQPDASNPSKPRLGSSLAANPTSLTAPVSLTLPPKIAARLWKTNTSFLHDRNVHDGEFAAFAARLADRLLPVVPGLSDYGGAVPSVEEVGAKVTGEWTTTELTGAPGDTVLRLIQTLSHLAFGIVSHGGDAVGRKQLYSTYAALLSAAFRRHMPACRAFADRVVERPFEFFAQLLICHHAHVRKAASSLLQSIFTTLRRFESGSYLETTVTPRPAKTAKTLDGTDAPTAEEEAAP